MQKHGSKLLALLMALCLVLSMLPTAALAEDSGTTATYTKVTSADELTTGRYVMVTSTGHAPGKLDGSWVTAVQPTVTEAGTIVDPTDGVWTLTVDGTSVKLTDANGTSIAPKGGNTNGIQSGDYSWAVTFADGTFTFAGAGDDTVKFASNAAQSNKFRAYKNGTISSNAGGYLCTFTLYKLAEDTAPARESGIVTDLTTLQDGDKVVVFNPTAGKALSTEYTGFYNKGVDVTLTDGVLAGYGDTELWTLGINEDSSYTFSTSSGSKLSMDTGYGSMPLDKANDTWSITAVEDVDARFFIDNVNRKAAEGSYQYRIQWDTRETALNWSAYNGTGDAFQQQLYLVIEDESGGETPEPEPTPTYSTIAEALAGENGTEFTVKGVVTLVEGQNLYLQDATGGICLRLSSADSSIALGDTVIGKGTKTVYNGLPQLGSGTATKDSGLTLSAKNTTIGALTTADICTYVTIRNVTVTEVYDNNGSFSQPNITVTDGTNSIQLYKAVINKNADGSWEYKVGDVLDITAAVGYFNKFQLRNTLASEVKAHVDGIIADGTYVVYNASAGKAMSSEATGTYYRAGKAVTLKDGKVENATNDIIWNFTFDGEYYTITTQDGDKLSMNNDRNSLPLNEANDKWTVEKSATDGCYYLVNATRTGSSGDHYYVEWYSGTSSSGSTFEEFTTYFYKSNNEAIYAMQLIPTAVKTAETGELPAAGDKVVIYNQNAGAVLAEQNDTQSINKALATITDGKATEVENGGVVFTVEKNGDYYRFKNETYGYLCSNGTGNNAFYSKDFSEDGVSTNDADWLVRTCSGNVGGFEMESRTAKFNGRYSQWLEYYSDSFKTYSMYNVTDYTIYSFYFYPVGESVKLQGDVVNDPKVVFTSADTVMKGQDYTLTFYLDDINTIADENITVRDHRGSAHTFTRTEDGYTATVPASKLTDESIIFAVEIKGADGETAYYGLYTVTIVDEPSIGAVTPASNSQTGVNKRPVISAEIINAGEGATLTMTVNTNPVDAAYEGGKLTYTPAEDMTDGRTTVVVTVTRADGKEVSKTWSFTVGETTFQLYFGQLHSHTQYSDGSGTLDSALSYVENLPASANVQFVAFTDHSNYFDGSKAGGTANPEGALYDMSLASTASQDLWNAYNASVDAFNEKNAGSMVALAGFEMTWSGGPGHINTFNTPGIVSRNNSTLNNKTADAGMKAYYALLSQAEGKDSLSQFNHPGTTFGNFSDFAYWDAVIDSRMYMVEVGNGEGQIGAGGYYPSYEQYIMALDKGWHLAPTNNQDNHKGRWGNANDARDVILTDNFTEEGIYDAIRELRMYATEDKNLQIGYTVNDLQMGSSINEVPEKLDFVVTVYDPDSSDSIAKVELVANSGKVAYTWDDPTELANGELTATLEPTYSYYFVRVTEGDGDLAVTAPVWVGESLKLGISSVECGTSTPVTDEELTITTTLFNSESSEATIKSVAYTVGDTVLEGTKSGDTTVPASGTATVTFNYTPTVAKLMTVTVTVVLTLDNEDYTFTMDLALDVQDASKLVYIGIDASHYNEYVAGNYADSMGNFSNLAAEYGIRTVELKTSEELIAACSNDKYVALIMTAPSRRLAAAQQDIKVYTADEIAAIKAFNTAGGTVIMAGWSDHYEYYPDALTMTADQHMAATQNAVLEALGSSIRISDDATYDDVRSKADGVDAWRLYFNTYGENFLTEGVEVDAEHPYDRLYTEVFSHYGGASIYTVDGSLPATVSPVVYGHSTTYSKDMDTDRLGGDSTPKYAYAEGDDRLLIMASEQLEGQGLIVVSGAAFMSNFEVQATIEDNGSEKNYSNYKICENLLAYLNPVTITPIADVQAEPEEGVKFTIEGVVTSNASGYDADTAFFDCIYVQDDTAGINAFPVAGNYKIGDKVRITGITSSYQGERQIAVTSIEKLGETTPVEPKAVTAAQLENKGYLGSLVTVEGTATKVEYANGLIQTIMVKDDSGKEARVFIDGYITTSKDVENAVVGCHVKATGLASYDNTFVLEDGTPVYQRIRIRDRADVICTEGESDPEPIVPTVPEPTEPGTFRFSDVPEGAWYEEAVYELYEAGVISGISATRFGPDYTLSRAMVVTMLYRISGESYTGESSGFTDVDDGVWYTDAVNWAAGNGIVKGVSETLFAPGADVTREQAVAMLYRYAQYKGYDVSGSAEINSFADAAEVSGYAVEAMKWAVASGIITGRENNRIAPLATSTRAEAVTMLQRFMNITK